MYIKHGIPYQPNLPVIIGILLLSMEVLRPVGKTNEKCFFFFFLSMIMALT